MNHLHAAVLGLVQGLGEFLPISSSAHLVIVPKLLGWPDQGLSEDVALHLGTLLALMLYFWRDWLKLITGGLKENGADRRMLLLLIAATIPGGVVGLLLKDLVERSFRDPLIIAAALMIFGVVLGFADWKGRKALHMQDMDWSSALWIGAAQALAILPGVSRSGITITAGLLLGFKREDAARFSFMLSVPIVAAAGMLHLRHMEAAALTGPFWVGIAVAALAGAAAIGLLLKWVRTRSLAPFVIYRLAFGTFLLSAAWLGYPR